MNTRIINIINASFKSRVKAALAIAVLIIIIFAPITASCKSMPAENKELPAILAAESFLADIASNIAGGRFTVDSLIAPGLDPHAFEPAPADIIKISKCDILIINGAGFEEWLNPAITDAMENIIIVEASKGLEFRHETKNSAGDENEHNNHDSNCHSHESEDQSGHIEENHSPAPHMHEHDPHFWLNPYLAITYVNNIRDALIDYDLPGKDFYEKHAGNYSAKLLELDKWIMEEVKKIPEDKRLLVTNHESFGYFADRYGFKIIGTIIPGSSTAASPSAKEVAQLIDQIKALNVGAIFLETGSDPKIAQQIANETGVAVITGMHTHSLTGPDGDAPTYIDMIKNNTIKIVESLK